MVTIEECSSRGISVRAPYHREFVEGARTLGGRWNRASRAWDFPSHVDEEVRAAAREQYGTDGRAGDYVTVEVTAQRELSATSAGHWEHVSVELAYITLVYVGGEVPCERLARRGGAGS